MATIDKKNLRLLIPWVLLGLALVALYYLLAPFLIAILSGAIFAIVLFPAHRFLMARWGFSPGSSAFSLIILATVLLLLPAGVVLWIAIRDGVEMIRDADLMDRFKELRWDLLGSYLPFEFNAQEFVRDFAKNIGSLFGSGLQKVLTSIPSNFAALGFTLLSGFFFLKDGPALKAWFLEKFPDGTDANSYVVEAFVKTSFGTVAASLASALVQALLTGLAFLICSVPNVALFTVSTFFLSLIPLVGAAPMWIGATLYLYFQDQPVYAIVMLVFGIVITLSDNVVKPIVIRNQSPMHPLIVLLTIFGGLQWLGPMGIILGPVFAAMILGAINMWMQSLSDKLNIQTNF